MTRTLSLVLLLGGVAVCTALEARGAFKEKTDTHTNPKYLDLAHYATSHWSSQQTGKTNFDTVQELVKVETQTVAGTNYRLGLKIAESVCPLTSTYTKEACTPKADAALRTCTAVVYEDIEGNKSLSDYQCEAA